MSWKCKVCSSELIAIYALTSKNNYWRKVDEKFKLIETDDSENEVEYERSVLKFICNCNDDCDSEEKFKERAIWEDTVS